MLAELCAGADVVFECGAVPVDLAALRAANPALVTVSITPFGVDRPEGRLAGHRPHGAGRRVPAGDVR